MRSPAQNSPTLRHRFEAALTQLAAALFKRLGPDRASALGGWIGRTVGPRLTPISSRAHRNLSAALPELSEAEVRRITREVWDNLGRTAAEYSHLEAFRLGHPEGRVTASGLEHLRGAIASGRPAIFVSGHFANWEVMSTVLFEEGLTYCLVYRRANNPLVDAAVQRWRSGLMSDQLAPKGKEGAKVILAALKAGQSLAMLVDQK
ncbi:MAG: lauroyl acyltransferase, partial [Pseudomonadota bacterium]